jgi:hypothetical protein
VLRQCEESGRFRLLLPADVLARSFIALEDGYGVNVLTGDLRPETEQQWLLDYAHIMVAAV